MKQKISQSLFALNRAKHLLHRDHLIILYYSLIYPYLSYGITIWGGTYNSHLNSLIVVQKRCIRNICSVNWYTHTEPLFKKLNILQLNDIYKLQICKYVHAYLMRKEPASLNDLFLLSQQAATTIITRQNTNFRLTVPSTHGSISPRHIMKKALLSGILWILVFIW